jgi:hypothetical protein
LKQFAAYRLTDDVPAPTTPAPNTYPKRHTHAKRHGHAAIHNKRENTYLRSTVPTPAASPLGPYKRVGYYDAESQVATGITFMGNYGGQGSGVWDAAKLGNSLSYVNAECTGGAASPQILANQCLKSNQEFSIFSSTPCDGDCTAGAAASSCGACRPGIPALSKLMRP